MKKGKWLTSMAEQEGRVQEGNGEGGQEWVKTRNKKGKNKNRSTWQEKGVGKKGKLTEVEKGGRA